MASQSKEDYIKVLYKLEQENNIVSNNAIAPSTRVTNDGGVTINIVQPTSVSTNNLLSQNV